MTLYTTHCAKCTMIENMLKQKDIKYVTVDDESKVLDVAAEHHMLSQPFAEIDGKFYNAQQLLEYVNKH